MIKKCPQCKEDFPDDDATVGSYHFRGDCMTVLTTKEFTFLKLELSNFGGKNKTLSIDNANLKREVRKLQEQVIDAPYVKAFQKADFNDFKEAVNFYKDVKGLVVDYFGEEETIIRI